MQSTIGHLLDTQCKFVDSHQPPGTTFSAFVDVPEHRWFLVGKPTHFNTALYALPAAPLFLPVPCQVVEYQYVLDPQ